MNRIFSKVWSKSLGAVVVASEIASGDRSGAVTHDRRVALHGTRPLALMVGLLLGTGFSGSLAAQDAGWTLTDTDGNAAVIGPEGVVTFQGDANISVTQTGDDDNGRIEIALNRDLDVDSITAGNTTLDTLGVAIGANVFLRDDGLRITGGPSVTTAGIDAGGSVITNVARGVAGTDAVNVDQLTEAQQVAGAGFSVSDGTSTANIRPNGTVTFTGDDNITVSQIGSDDDGEIQVALNADLSVDSLTTGATTIDTTGVTVGDNVALGATGLTITGGPSVTSAGIDAGNLVVGNVADGSITQGSKQAVTGGQLYDLRESLYVEGGGVKYFHANSEQADSISRGEESIAIGPNTVTNGDSSLAAGDGALTREGAEGAIALGQGAVAGTDGAVTPDGVAAIAIGRNSQAGGTSTVAIGDGASVASEYVTGAIALGLGASVTGDESDDATAIGSGAHASAGNATALGAGAQALASGAIAIGQAEATAGNAFAAGSGAFAGSPDSIALGSGAGVGTFGTEAGDRTSHIAIGTQAGNDVVGNQTIAVGFRAGSNVDGDQNVAMGSHAGSEISGDENVSIGFQANRGAGTVDRATAIGGNAMAYSDAAALGYDARAQGVGAVALGAFSRAGADGVAIGHQAQADDGHIALGRGSAARAGDVLVDPANPASAIRSAYLTGDTPAGLTTVSVGNSDNGTTRRIVNLADGSHGTDAVNVRQLQAAQRSVANLVGGGVGLSADGSFGQITLYDLDGEAHYFNTIVDALGAVSSGVIDVTALPPDVVRYIDGGRIANVGAGIDGNDAVNVEQLNQAVADGSVKYHSVNSTDAANRDNSGASGADAVAIGARASAAQARGVALGFEARSQAIEAVAIGTDVSALGRNSTVVGSDSTVAYGEGGVAIGRDARSQGVNSIVVGTGAQADPKNSDSTVDNAIVIGTVAEVTADDGIAIGHSALASEARAIAQGFDAHATAQDASAVGTRARATGVSAQASGTDARASGTNAIANGTDARAFAADGIALGTGAVSGISNPLPGQEANNINAIAIGNTARADQRNALALGVEAQARAMSSMAIGDQAFANALHAQAVGTGARATAEGAMALGTNASAANANAVALGSNAVTAAAIGTASTVVDKVTYQYAGTSPVATVSVGAPGQERTITNVAAGRVSATSTDAINGSQLFGTNQAVTALGNNLDTLGTTTARALGGTSSYNVDTHTLTAGLSVRGTNYTNVESALQYAAQGWNVGVNGTAGTNVAPGQGVDFSNTDGNIDISRTGRNLVFDLADDIEVDSLTAGNTVVDTTGVAVGTDVKLGATGLTAGDVIVSGVTNTVTGLGNTTWDPDATYNAGRAATEEQLKSVSDVANAGWNVAANGEATGANVAPAGKVDFSNTDGNIVIDRTGTDLVFDLADDIEVDSLTAGNTVVDANGVAVGDDVTLGDTGLTVLGDAGTTVVDGNGLTTGTVVVSGVTNDVTGLGNTTWDPDATYSDGRAATEEQLKSVSDVANAGWNVAANGEATGANVAPAGKVDFSNTDGNIVIDRTGTDLVFDLADDIEVDSLTAGDTVVDANGVAVGDDVTLGDTGLTVLGDAGSTIVDGNGLTTGTVVVSGVTNDVTGLGNTTWDPDATYADGRAATEEQLKSVSDAAFAGWTVTDAEGNEANIGPNGVVTFVGDDNLTVAQTGADQDGVVAITLNKDLDLGVDGSVTIGDIAIDGDGLTIVGGPSVTVDGIDAGGSVIGNVAAGIVDTDAVNVGQLNDTVETNRTKYYSVNDNGVQGGNYDNDGATGINAVAIGVNSVAAGDGSYAAGTGAQSAGNNSVAIGNQARALVAGSLALGEGAIANGQASIAQGVRATASTTGAIAMGVNATANNVHSVAIGSNAQALHNNSVALGTNSVTGATVATTGATLNGTEYLFAGAAPTSTVSVGNVGAERTITNVAAGRISATSTDAINGSQLHATNTALDEVAEAANAGWNVSAQGDNATNVGLNSPTGNSVDLNNSDGNIVVTKADDSNDVTFDLADDLVIANSISVGDTVVDANGVAVGDDVTLGAGGLTVVGDTTTVVDGSGLTTGTVVVSGVTNDVTGLGNTTWDPNATYSDGRAATEEQLKSVSDVANAGWNVTDADGNTANIGPNGVVTFVGDSNLTVAQTGEDQDGVVEITLNKDLDLGVDGSVAIGDTRIDATGVAIGSDVKLGDTGLTIVGGPSVTVDGIDAGGLVIGNVATGVAGTDAVNVDQLNDTVETNRTKYYSFNDGGVIGANYNNDGAAGIDSLAAGKGASTTGAYDVAVGTGANTTGGYGGTAVGGGIAGDPDRAPTTAGQFGTAIGFSAQARGTGDTAVGTYATTGDDAEDAYRTAIGYRAEASGIAATAIGQFNRATGARSVANGYEASALADDAVAIGSNATASHAGSVALGAGSVTDAAVATTGVTLNGTARDFAGTAPTSTISVGSVGNERTITNVAAGRISATSTDAINGSQLHATNTALEEVAQVANAGWNVSAQGDNATNVGLNSPTGNNVDLNNSDGNIVVTKADDSNDVTFDLADDLTIAGSISVGDTVIDATGVAIGSDVKLGDTGLTIVGGPSVTVDGIDAGGLVIGNVATGVAGTDAVNVDQLNDTVETNRTKYYSVNSSGGGNFDNDGATGADAIASGKDAEAEGDEAVAMGLAASAAGDGSVAIGSGAQAQALNSLAFGAGAVASHANSIALGAGSATTVGAQASYQGAYVGDSSSTGEVNLGGRQVTGVAAGSAATDAVNVSQLQGGVNHAINVSNEYTDTQIGGVNTRIDQLDDRVTTIEGDIVDIRGDITDIQGDIVDIRGDITDLDDRVTNVEGDVANIVETVNQVDNRITKVENGADGMFQVSQEGDIVKPTPTGTNSSAGGNGAVASGNNALALGNQSTASGADSTAVGTGATASAANSTALGQGAKATHANSVALGSGSATTVGAQSNYNAAYVGSSNSTGEVNVGGRTITGVAPGVAGTDAVNVNQLNGGVNHAINTANQYTDSRINDIQGDMWSMERGYRGATASAMAMAGLPQAYLPGKSMLAVGFGGYQSEYGMAVGLSGITENGRYVYKAQASGNTSRDWGFSVGAGWQW